MKKYRCMIIIASIFLQNSLAAAVDSAALRNIIQEHKIVLGCLVIGTGLLYSSKKIIAKNPVAKKYERVKLLYRGIKFFQENKKPMSTFFYITGTGLIAFSTYAFWSHRY